jgi:hypothetical protein
VGLGGEPLIVRGAKPKNKVPKVILPMRNISLYEKRVPYEIYEDIYGVYDSYDNYENYDVIALFCSYLL